MAAPARERWFAQMIAAGLDEKLITPADVLAHATPEVLAAHLPAELMSRVLQASLAAGIMTADTVLETVDATQMATYVPHALLWACIASAAERAGVARASGG